MMKIILACLIAAHCLLLVQPLRFIDRLPGRRFPIPKRCLIAEADVAERFVTPDLRDMIVKEAKPLLRVYASMNCSMVFQEWTSVGKEDSNGSFDGVIGYLQRNENDITIGLFPTDMFRKQPGLMVTTGQTGSAVIVSKKNETLTETLPLLRLWANGFDAITADYFLIVVFLFVVVLSFIVSKKRLDAGGWMVNYISNCCNAIIALIGHGSLNPMEESGRIAVLFFNFFILFAIRGIMLSTFSADLVYEIDPPIIESVDEFTNDSYTQPAVVKQLYFLEAMQKAEPGSSFWRLNQIVQSHPNVSIWDFDINSDMDQLRKKAYRYVSDVDDSRSALLTDELTWPSIKMALCTMRPEIVKHIRSSRSFRNTAPVVMLMSYQIDPDLRKVHEHMVSLARQSALWSAVINNIYPPMLMTYTATPASVVRDCEMGTTHEPHEHENFKFETFEPIFRGFAAALALSLITFMFEYNMKTCVRIRARWTTRMIRSSRQVMTKFIKFRHRRRRVRPKSSSDNNG